MDIITNMLGLAVVVVGIVASVFTLNGHRDIALWLYCLALEFAVLGGTCLLQDYWWKKDAQATALEPNQRAWLGISDVSIEPLSPGQPTNCKIGLKNSGATPGTITELTVSAANFPKTNPADCEELMKVLATVPKSPPRKTSIPPGHTIFLDVHHEVLTEADIKAVNERSRELFVVAKIAYSDISGESHLTRCCFRYDPDKRVLFAYPRYNDME